MDLNEPQFTRSDVVSVTGVDTEALKSWLKHGFVTVSPLQEGGHQKRRFFSVMDMIKIAVISELTLLTVNSSTANEIISSEKFAIWIDKCLFDDGGDDVSRWYFAAMYHDGSRTLVDFISSQDQWALVQRQNDDVVSSAKVIIVVRLLDIVLKVWRGAKYLVLGEAPEETLTSVQQTILTMRRHRKNADGVDHE